MKRAKTKKEKIAGRIAALKQDLADYLRKKKPRAIRSYGDPSMRQRLSAARTRYGARKMLTTILNSDASRDTKRKAERQFKLAWGEE